MKTTITSQEKIAILREAQDLIQLFAQHNDTQQVLKFQSMTEDVSELAGYCDLFRFCYPEYAKQRMNNIVKLAFI